MVRPLKCTSKTVKRVASTTTGNEVRPREQTEHLKPTHVASSTHLDTPTGNTIIRLRVSAIQQENNARKKTVEIFGEFNFCDFFYPPNTLK